MLFSSGRGESWRCKCRFSKAFLRVVALQAGTAEIVPMTVCKFDTKIASEFENAENWDSWPDHPSPSGQIRSWLIEIDQETTGKSFLNEIASARTIKPEFAQTSGIEMVRLKKSESIILSVIQTLNLGSLNAQSQHGLPFGCRLGTMRSNQGSNAPNGEPLHQSQAVHGRCLAPDQSPNLLINSQFIGVTSSLCTCENHTGHKQYPLIESLTVSRHPLDQSIISDLWIDLVN